VCVFVSLRSIRVHYYWVEGGFCSCDVIFQRKQVARVFALYYNVLTISVISFMSDSFKRNIYVRISSSVKDSRGKEDNQGGEMVLSQG